MKVFSKITLPVTLAIALSVLTVAIFSYWYLEKQLFNEMYLERKDDVLRTSKVLLTKEVFSDPYSESSQKNLTQFIENLRAADVIRATIWDLDGNVLASDLASIVGQKATRHDELFSVYQTKRTVFLEKNYDNNSPLQTSVSPIRIALIPLTFDNEVLGVIELHMTNVIIGKTIDQSVYSIAALLLSMGVLLTLALVFVVRKVVVGPIHVITAASQKISKGDFDAVVDLNTNDEIGALAKVFIEMKDHLKENISELERKKMVAEDANRKATAEKLRAEGILNYLRSIGEGVYATDNKGNIVFCNASAAQIAQKTPEDLMGKKSVQYFKFCIGVDKEVCDFVPFQEAVTQKKSQEFSAKTFIIGIDGKKIPVSGTYSPIVKGNHVTGAIVVFQDITKSYELEQLKDRFLSIAAHQLRTPLGSMRWSMEMLEAGDLGKLPKDALDAVQELQKNSSRMMALVNDLLNVSRIDQGTVKEDPKEVDLGEIVAEAVKTLEGDASKKGIVFKFELPKKIPKIFAIRSHVFEAIENLISNSIRYGRSKGTTEIAITAKKEGVLFSVADNGIGIPEEDQSKLFGKFFRASNAAKSFTDGSGLGLSVVKSYVEEAGGTIRFESKEGVGTTFFIQFPSHPTEKA